MKLEEKIKELKQLDRIEYRQRAAPIVEMSKYLEFPRALKEVMIFALIILLIDLFYYAISNNVIFIESYVYLFCVGTLYVFGTIVVDILKMKKAKDKMEELEEEFFEVKVKK